MSVPQKSRPPWRFLVVLALIAFGLNWAWEMVQMPAFAEMAGRPWLDTIPLCTRAALGDVAFTLGIYLTVGCGRWARTGRWPFYAAAAILGGVSGAVFERWALGAGRWSYTRVVSW